MIRFVGTLKTFFFNFGKPLFFGLCGITLILTAYSNCSQLRSLKQNSASFLDKDDLVEMYSFASTGQIIGNVEGISDMGNYIVVSGWACEVGNPDARDVHIKISAEGATTYAGARSPDLYRELEVQSACKIQSPTSQSAFGFSISFSDEYRNKYLGKKIIVTANDFEINGSNKFEIPARATGDPIPHLFGYFSGIRYDSNGSLELSGWACYTIGNVARTGPLDNTEVKIIDENGATVAIVPANSLASSAIKSTCIATDVAFSTIIPADRADQFIGKTLRAVANFPDINKTLQLEPTSGYRVEGANQSVFPYTSSELNWTGPGGSFWRHRIILMGKSPTNLSQFSIRSSSYNAIFTNGSLNEIRANFDIGNNECREVSMQDRWVYITETKSYDIYKIFLKICFTKVSGADNWDISFSHWASNITQGGATTPGTYGPTHGTIQLRPH